MKKNLSGMIIITGLLCLFMEFATAQAQQVELFYEDFQGFEFSRFERKKPGLPRESDGAKQTWYGGRFEHSDPGSIDSDLAVRRFGGTGFSHGASLEDNAGLLFKLSTAGFTDISLNFDYRTSLNVFCNDRFVAGYFVGELPFGTSRYRDFLNDDFGGDESAAKHWWNTQWTEIVRDRSVLWNSITDQALPENQETVWVAFWLDNGEHDVGMIDNIRVVGNVIPEPVSVMLFLLGGSAMALKRRRGCQQTPLS